jgi:hypothetical protein
MLALSSGEREHAAFGFRGNGCVGLLQRVQGSFLGVELLNRVPILYCLRDVPSDLSFADICGAFRLFVKVAGIRSDAFRFSAVP